MGELIRDQINTRAVYNIVYVITCIKMLGGAAMQRWDMDKDAIFQLAVTKALAGYGHSNMI